MSLKAAGYIRGESGVLHLAFVSDKRLQTVCGVPQSPCWEGVTRKDARLCMNCDRYRRKYSWFWDEIFKDEDDAGDD